MPIDRRLVVGGVVIGGAGLAYWLYKKSKAASTTATANTTGYGYGYGYGAYGYGSEPGYGYGYGGYGYGGFASGATGGVTGGGASPGYYGYGYGGTGPATQISTNSQWLTEATSMLTSEGYSGATVQAALGAYLAGSAVTADEQAIISAAISAAGYPPQSGASGYPPAINTSAAAGQSTGGVTPAQPGGGTSAAKAGAISNLQATNVTKTGFTVRWNPVNGASGYAWIVTDTKNNSRVSASPTGGQTGSSVTVNGLQSGTTYNFGVQALPGGTGNNIHVTTK